MDSKIDGIEIQLEDFKDGKPIIFHGENETVQKIAALKRAKKFKELYEFSLQLPNNIDTYLLRANSLLHLREWNRLIDCCNNGLMMDESESEFYNLKGKAMGKLGNQQQKVQLLKKAISLNNKIAAYHRNLGAAYYNLKNYSNAVREHGLAIELEPKNPINYHNRGAAHFRNKQFNEAKVNFKLAFENDPKLALSYSWLGDCEKELGNYDDAIKLYGKAYDISGNMLYKKQKEKLEKEFKKPEEKKTFFFGLF